MELILNGDRISNGTCSFLETFFFYCRNIIPHCDGKSWYDFGVSSVKTAV